MQLQLCSTDSSAYQEAHEEGDKAAYAIAIPGTNSW